MANRNVELILRAKNEASAAIQSVTDALDALEKAQVTTGEGASKAGTEIGTLAKDLENLESRAKSLETLQTVSKTIADTEAHVGRLSSALELAQASFSSLQADSQRVANSLSNFREALAASNGALESEKSNLSTLDGLYRGVTTELNSAGRALSELTTKFNQSEGAEARFAKQLEGAVANLAELRSKMATATAASDTSAMERFGKQIEIAETRVSSLTGLLQRQKDVSETYASMMERSRTAVSGLTSTQASLEQAMAATRNNIDSSKTAVSNFSKEISKAEGEERSLAAALDKSALAVERANGDFKTGSEALAEMRSKASLAADRLGAAELTTEALGKAAATTATDLQRVSAALQSTSGKEGSSFTVPERSLSNYKALIQNVRDARAAFDAATERATALGRALATTTGPTETLGRELRLAQAEVVATERAFLSAGEALGTFAGRANGSFSAFESAASKIRAPVNTLSELNAALIASRDRFEAVSANLTRVSREYATAAVKTSDMKTAVIQAAEATARAEAEFNRAAEAVSRFRNQGTGSFRQLEETIRQLGPATAQMGSSFNTAASDTTRFIASIRSLISGIGQYLGATRGATDANAALASSMNRVANSSREALSVFQRIRGEVLGYIAAYGGIQGAVQGLESVIKSTRALEAAENRLGAVNDQSLGKVNDTIDRLRQRSMYLGQSFAVTTDEYSKFAVAAKEANFESEATNKIFDSVAVAARVNKLSVDQLKGVYLALTQMISKGKITSEELRRQLGDRLPGAFNLMAKALKMTTAELDNAMKHGEVFSSQENMLAFADQLIKSFGSQLPQALQTLSTQLDLLGNTSEQVGLQIGSGGFAESLRKLLLLINGMVYNRDARDFFLGIGAAAGRAVDGVRFLAENFDLVKIALEALISLKAGSILSGMLSGIAASAKKAGVEWTSFASATAGSAFAMKSMAMTMTDFATAMKTSEGRIGILKSALGGILTPFKALGEGIKIAGAAVYGFGENLSIANIKAAMFKGTATATGFAVATIGNAAKFAAFGVRSLLDVFGGWRGIMASFVAFFAADWLTGFMTTVDETTAKIDEHQRIIDAVKVAYEKWGDNAERVAEALKGVVSKDQMNKSLREQTQLFEDAKKEAADYYGGLETYAKIGTTSEYSSVKSLREEFGKGKISAEKFREELSKIYDNTTNDGVRQYLEKLLDLARKAEIAEQRVKALEAAMKKVGANLPDFTEKSRIEKFIDWLKGAGSWLLKIAEWAGGAVVALAALGTISGAVSRGWGTVVAIFARLGPLISAVVSTARVVAGALSAAGTAAGIGFGAVEIAIVALVAAAAFGAVKIIQNWDAVKQWFSNLGSAITGALSSAWEWISSTGSSLWDSVVQAASSAWDGIVAKVQSAATSIRDYFSSAMDWVISKLQEAYNWATKLAGVNTGSGNSGGASGAQTLAEGGRVSGPGSETSDSVDAKLSVNEWVMRAKAVRFYGAAFMSRINSLSMPRFGFAGGGGLIAAPAVATAPATSAMRPINLNLDGNTFKLFGPSDVARDLVDYSRAAKARSAGRTPNWTQGRRK